MNKKDKYEVVILAYQGMTMLDAIGPNEVLANSPYFNVTWASSEADGISNDHDHFSLQSIAHFEDVDRADILIIPGGPGDKAIMQSSAIIDWIKRIDSQSILTTSVCTGSLILGATGLLEGKNACSHWACLNELRTLGAKPVRKRFIQDGKYVTASGVSAGIDMALYLVRKLVDKKHAKELRFGIEYFPSQLNLISTYTLPASVMAKLESKVGGVIESTRKRITPQ